MGRTTVLSQRAADQLELDSLDSVVVEGSEKVRHAARQGSLGAHEGSKRLSRRLLRHII